MNRLKKPGIRALNHKILHYQGKVPQTNSKRISHKHSFPGIQIFQPLHCGIRIIPSKKTIKQNILQIKKNDQKKHYASPKQNMLKPNLFITQRKKNQNTPTKSQKSTPGKRKKKSQNQKRSNTKEYQHIFSEKIVSPQKSHHHHSS
ncbi:MAG: hypothetical protein R3B71_01715 [Candidatus Gracilibacteria bacterium]